MNVKYNDSWNDHDSPRVNNAAGMMKIMMNNIQANTNPMTMLYFFKYGGKQLPNLNIITMNVRDKLAIAFRHIGMPITEKIITAT